MRVLYQGLEIGMGASGHLGFQILGGLSSVRALRIQALVSS